MEDLEKILRHDGRRFYFWPLQALTFGRTVLSDDLPYMCGYALSRFSYAYAYFPKICECDGTRTSSCRNSDATGLKKQLRTLVSLHTPLKQRRTKAAILPSVRPVSTTSSFWKEVARIGYTDSNINVMQFWESICETRGDRLVGQLVNCDSSWCLVVCA